MKKTAILLILLMSGSNLYSQTNKNKVIQNVKQNVKPNAKQKKAVNQIPNIPIQVQYSNRFNLSGVNFNKRIDYAGTGEILEVQFVLENNLDDSQDLYLFVIASYEKSQRKKSSFEMPVKKEERIRSFVPYPDDIENFQYQDPDEKEKMIFLKYPKNPLFGVAPATGKYYQLKDKLNIWTTHLSEYRNKYYFFNEVAILIFDKQGKPLFRQLYKIHGKRI